MAILDEFNRGNLIAYIELLKTGIREICLPNISSCKKSALDKASKEARRNGFNTLLVTYKGIRRIDERKRNLYQLIVYCKGRRVDAERLRRVLQKNPKGKADARAIGELLGYSEEAIASFLRR